MIEIFHESIRWANLPYTILLGLILFYWLLVILGALDIDLADFDFLSDVDTDLDGAVPTETGWLAGVLQFLNLGQVPTMIVASFMAISLWSGSILLNHYWSIPSSLVLIALSIPNLLIAGVVTHFCARPFRRLFQELNREGEETLPITGRYGKIITSEVNDHFGQVEIETEGAPLVISARAPEGKSYAKGESVVVVNEISSESSFLVKPLGITE
jgi:hypothetical protein